MPTEQFDLVIAGGRVIDPASGVDGIRDIGVRHGRIAADYLIGALGGERFGWGAGLDVETDELRAAYRHALQRADGGEIDALLAFARS